MNTDRKIPLMYMQIFRPGTQVQYNGNIYTVDHVGLSGYRLRVYLVDYPTPIDSHLLQCEPTELDFNRK